MAKMDVSLLTLNSTLEVVLLGGGVDFVNTLHGTGIDEREDDRD